MRPVTLMEDPYRTTDDDEFSTSLVADKAFWITHDQSQWCWVCDPASWCVRCNDVLKVRCSPELLKNILLLKYQEHVL